MEAPQHRAAAAALLIPKTAGTTAEPQPPVQPRVPSRDPVEEFAEARAPNGARLWINFAALVCCCCISCSEACQDWSKDCRACCVSFRKGIKSAAFLYTFCVLVLLFGIFVISAGWTISGVYWDEDFQPIEEALQRNASTLNGTAGEAAKKALEAWNRRPIFRHFPMGFVHLVPLLLVAMGFFTTCCFSPEPINASEIDEFSGDSTGRLSSFAISFNFGLAIYSVVWMVGGLVMAAVLVVSLATTVYRDRNTPKVVAVPAISCLFATVCFATSLCCLYLAFWRSVVESRTRNEYDANTFRMA